VYSTVAPEKYVYTLQGAAFDILGLLLPVLKKYGKYGLNLTQRFLPLSAVVFALCLSKKGQ
jgi:hypothetical protein